MSATSEIVKILVTAALKTLPGVPSERAEEAVADTVLVVDEEGPLPGLTTENTYKIVLEWQAREAALRGDLRGDFDKDGIAHAFGALQIHRWAFDGHTEKEILQSRPLGIKLGMQVMRSHILRCGSVRRGLGAFATNGICGGAPSLVAWRCTKSGAC